MLTFVEGLALDVEYRSLQGTTWSGRVRVMNPGLGSDPTHRSHEFAKAAAASPVVATSLNQPTIHAY